MPNESNWFIYKVRLYPLAILKTTKELSMSNPRVPDLAHDLIECSICHRIIESPDIEECEFCNEDVCDDCWDKHQCDQVLFRPYYDE